VDRKGPSIDYFVTGGTGFIGRHLVKHLLGRGSRVYAPVREAFLPTIRCSWRRWTRSADQILASLRRFCQYTLDSHGIHWRTSDPGC
jgi:nucleoside-diphosphate-sugar epimerase